MIHTTDKGVKIKSTEVPHYNEFHKKYYVWGHRFVNTKQTWSGQKTLHNFDKFTTEEEG